MTQTSFVSVHVECKSEGHIKYHFAHSTSITEPFEGQFGIGSSPFHGRFHVFKHSKVDETKPCIAEVNVTSPERIMCGHFLLCYCCLLFFSSRGVRSTSSAGIALSPITSFSFRNSSPSASSNGVLPPSLLRLVLLMWLSKRMMSSCV